MTSGTGTCTVKYDQAGNANYSAAPQVTESTTATAASQTITVTTHAPANAAFNAQFTVAATSSSGLTVSYSSSGSCTNTGALFTMTSGTGTCTVKYDQAGNANYSAAPQVTESTTASPAAQTITVTTHAPAAAAPGTAFTVTATATSGLPVAVTTSGGCTGSGSGSALVTMTNAGTTCTVNYNQAGNASYTAAPQVTESVASGYNVCLLYDSAQPFRAGSSATIKLRLCDAAGNNLSSGSIVLHAQVVTDSGNNIVETLSGNFSFSKGSYSFKVNTSGLPGGAYNLDFTAGAAPTVYQAPFTLQQNRARSGQISFEP
jgi:hypothetical protein